MAQLAISRAIGADEPAYQVRGAVARDAQQGLSFHFSASGVAVSSARGSAELGLQTRPTVPIITRNRVTYTSGAVSQWYANGPLGLEQGFTLAKGAPDVLRLSAGGTLRAQVSDHGAGLLFLNARGRAVLRDRGLSAWDASGRALPVRFKRAAGGGLAISVRLAGAVFPVTIDPLVQSAELTANDEYAYEGDGAGFSNGGASAGGVGSSVAIDGTTIAVGAPGAPVTYGPGESTTYPSGVTNSYQGAVYVFTEPLTGWANATAQTAKLVASDGEGAGGAAGPSSQNVYGDALGSSVAISGNTIVAGAPRTEAGGQYYAGKIYVFTAPSAGWVNSFQTAELAASDASMDDELGSAVAFDGQTIVAAVPNRNSSNFESSAYVFAKPSSGGWIPDIQTTEIQDPAFSPSDDFGASVAVSGSTIAVGAPYTTDGSAQDAGAVYTFTNSGAGWKGALTQAKLVPTTPVTYETVGESVGINGSTLVTGAPHYVGNGGPKPSGAAYVFTKGASWQAATQARLTAPDGTSSDSFGALVEPAGSSVFVAGYPGGVANLYQFTEPTGGWVSSSQATENSLPAAAGSGSGQLAVQGSTIVAGAPEANDGSTKYAGAALVLSTSTTPTTTTPTTTTTTPTTTTTTPTATTPTTPTTATPTTTTPATTTYQAPSGGTLTYTSTPAVVNTITTADIVANLFGLTPGSGETENLGEFTFVAYCSKPQGQCAASTSFGQQLGTVTAARAGAAKSKKPKPIVYGTGRISIPAGKHGKVTVKLTALGRRLLKQDHVLRGTLLISLATSGSSSHKFTLRYKPKAKTRKR